ncbi:hypothetical protein GFS60_06470 (plasmid) [Rhodococcus sp. WAY2]|nr:hypothetical protein GFS60_06470 [Rhodococcus sp. WAY2]
MPHGPSRYSMSAQYWELRENGWTAQGRVRTRMGGELHE